MSLSSVVVTTTPFEGQKPGTSGLRKKVKVFMEKHYTENFIQSIFNALGDKVKGSTLIVGGDGRYFSKQAINIIIRIASANGVAKLIIGQLGILSTPAVSSLIRTHNVLGGIVLTASHNPGGIRNDFGIKYNIENGGPAPDSVSDAIYENTKKITEYRTTPKLETDRLIDIIGTTTFNVDGRDFVVEIIDSAINYVSLMKEIFDFPKLRTVIRGTETRPAFNVLIDSMNGVTGVYVRRIFVEELGASPDHNVCRIIPLDNFGEIHPDPNLTYAKDLVDKVKDNEEYDLGAAFDGDGDRNMIIGKKAFFVTPSDSLAVLANNLQCIPYFQKNGVHGFARSMPTAAAVDRVASKLGKEMFEVPTGWKYFGNLMDAGRLSLCGEESFGTGSDHIREKDGIWAVLAWLSIIEHKNMSVEDILKEHWSTYGRNYFTRYDYEECESDAANQMMAHLEQTIASKDFVGKSYTFGGKTYTVSQADNFSYVDPIDNSVAKNQGIRVLFEDGSRLIYRLSGTGSSGATIRVYIDSYEKENVLTDAQVVLKPLVEIGLEISQLKKFTGRDAPTVIT
ncbi:phosphoglucomutase isoform X1 [Anoplophora glabripennis]|uniref:phosphoglucomutase isoform X2 n=1 Tax=Anoplophora glabripennis TaxID=217634 RepID=UPI0008745325|nr:phosphoglucomutase isoform X2 [Anoplophora glabripennis]XP_023309822.1 phosphoglucomutase isoform X1 [Anoplophora glabripennis]